MADEWQGKTVSELIADTLAKLKQPLLNYDRYSRTRILQALNAANVEAVRRTKCLHSFAIITMKDGYSQYKPPTNMIHPTRAYFYQSATSYYELLIKSRSWLDKYQAGWRVSGGDPSYMYIGDSFGNLRKLGFTPTPDTDGTSYTLSPDTGIFVSSSGVTTTGNITGVNTTADSTICTDSAARTLTDLGVTVGMMALNVTDGSSGQISDVTGSTFTVTLSGGTADTWAIGDQFTILAGEYGVVTSWENDEQYLFSDEYGAMIDVKTLENNVYLEYVKRPLLLQYDTQYPELKPELHDYLSDYAEYYLRRRATRGSEDYQIAMTALQLFNNVIPPVQDYSPEGQVEPSFIRYNW